MSGKKMRSFIALFALAAIATGKFDNNSDTFLSGILTILFSVADAAAAKAAGTAEETPADLAAADPGAAEAAVATPEDRAVGDCPDGFIPLAECNKDTIEICVRVGRPIKVNLVDISAPLI